MTGRPPDCRYPEVAPLPVGNAQRESVNPLTAQYLNRLSDLLFILARRANESRGDVLWKPGGER